MLTLQPDHILITGDLTTTALPAEFKVARRALAPWLLDPTKVTVLPGNHDRYTPGSHRARLFEKSFGEFAPKSVFPWLRFLDGHTVILGLDPTRASLTARGRLPEHQLGRAKELVAGLDPGFRRLIVACHYPLDVPADHRRDLARKNLINAEELVWLARYARPSSLLLRSRPHGLGVRAPAHSRPALFELGRSAPARP